MFSLFYDLLICVFGTLSLVFQRIFRGKHKGVLRQKLGLQLPFSVKSSPEQQVFWIHSVSLGETKATRPFIKKLRDSFPDSIIYVSTMTDTGLQEAKSIPEVSAAFYLPLDLSWTMKKIVGRLKPNYVFLIENDVWLNFLKFAKKADAQVYWLSAKLSERSFKRYQTFSFYAKKVFSLFDHILAQNSMYLERFKSFVAMDRLSIGGDLKFDATVIQHKISELNEWRSKLSLQPEDFVISIACTHDPEEKKLLKSLNDLLEKYPYIKVLLAPRHPERFSDVHRILDKEPISHVCLSQIHSIEPNHRIVLIDTMGFLPTCYQLSQLAIVGGSFEKGVGGHNILEPCHFNVPVIFGPFMDSQKSLKEKVLLSGAGEMVAMDDLSHVIELYIRDTNHLNERKRNAQSLIKNLRGSLNRTWQRVFSDRD